MTAIFVHAQFNTSSVYAQNALYPFCAFSDQSCSLVFVVDQQNKELPTIWQHKTTLNSIYVILTFNAICGGVPHDIYSVVLTGGHRDYFCLETCFTLWPKPNE